MFELNLPKTELKVVRDKGKMYVFDILRQKYVSLTPEEWVRQNFTRYLIEHKGYPAALLGNEISLSLNTTSKRCDTVLYDKQAKPVMIVEYKAPNVSITQRTFDQISRYNIVMHVDYLVVSNGLQHYCCKMDYERNTYAFLRELPDYDQL